MIIVIAPQDLEAVKASLHEWGTPVVYEVGKVVERKEVEGKDFVLQNSNIW